MPSCLACARKLATTAAIWIERCARWTAGLAWKMHGRRERTHAACTRLISARQRLVTDATLLLVRPSNDPKRITGCGEYTKTSSSAAVAVSHSTQGCQRTSKVWLEPSGWTARHVAQPQALFS